MHKPKFSKKCYDCTNRFICWTSREELPKVDGLPICKKCGKLLEVVGDLYYKNLMDKKILCVKARCPEHTFFNRHDGGQYMEIQPKRWVWVFSWW